MKDHIVLVSFDAYYVVGVLRLDVLHFQITVLFTIYVVYLKH